MLILTRRAGETLVIGNDINVRILSVKGGQVRIGVDAPKDVPVHREEIYQRIQREKEQQVDVSAADTESDDNIGNQILVQSTTDNEWPATDNK